jgi:hypothetical protein
MSEVWYKKRALFPPVNGRLKVPGGFSKNKKRENGGKG